VFHGLTASCLFTADAAQESAPESASRRREDRRLTEFSLPPSALTNRDIGDLRWVQSSEPPPTIIVSTWQTVFYTDNVFLTHADKRESTGWNGDMAIQFIPYSTWRWTPWIAADYFLYRYQREPSEDFDGQSLTIGSRLNLSEDQAWRWDLSYSLWRFTEARDRSDEFFKEGLLENEITWTALLSARPAIYSEIGYGMAFRHASPGEFDRLENELGLRLHYFPWRALRITPYGRAAIRQYTADEGTEGHRSDLHFESGLVATWDISRNFSLHAEVNATWNDSNRSEEDYEVFEPQISLYAELDF